MVRELCVWACIVFVKLFTSSVSFCARVSPGSWTEMHCRLEEASSDSEAMLLRLVPGYKAWKNVSCCDCVAESGNPMYEQLSIVRSSNSSLSGSQSSRVVKIKQYTMYLDHPSIIPALSASGFQHMQNSWHTSKSRINASGLSTTVNAPLVFVPHLFEIFPRHVYWSQDLARVKLFQFVDMLFREELVRFLHVWRTGKKTTLRVELRRVTVCVVLKKKKLRNGLPLRLSIDPLDLETHRLNISGFTSQLESVSTRFFDHHLRDTNTRCSGTTSALTLPTSSNMSSSQDLVACRSTAL